MTSTADGQVNTISALPQGLEEYFSNFYSVEAFDVAKALPSSSQAEPVTFP